MITETFRKAVTDEDYEVCARISSEQEPDSPVTADLLRRHEVIVPKGTKAHRELMEVDGKPVGHVRTIQLFWGDSPTTYETRCMCGPAEGAHFPNGQQRAMDLALADGATVLSTWSDERFPERLDWLAAQGFKETQRNPVSYLDLKAFEPDRWRPVHEKGLKAGIQIRTYEELIETGGEGIVQRLWELEESLMADVPLPYEWKGIPYEEFKQYLDADRRHWPTLLVAVDGGQFVGQTQLFLNEVEPTLGTTGLTGVVRSHRRRGIAAALKVQSLSQAKALGVRRLGTDNEQKNPMYQLNLDLGFRCEYEAIGFERAQ